MPSKVQLIGGDFQDAEGNVLANGYLLMKLSQDTTVAGVGNVASGVVVKIRLNAFGNVDTVLPQYVWANDQMVPDNTFYRVTGYTAAGQPAWGPNNQQVLGNGGSFDLTTWVPNQMFYWNPPVSAVALETNGVRNGSQSLLNLVEGANITLTDSGNGTVSVAASVPSGITLETNGVLNGSQSLLNLKSGANITLTESLGAVTISGDPYAGLRQPIWAGTKFVTSNSPTNRVSSGFMGDSNLSIGATVAGVASTSTTPQSIRYTSPTTAWGGQAISSSLGVALNGNLYVSAYSKIDDSSSLDCNVYPLALSPLPAILINGPTSNPLGSDYVGFYSANSGTWMAVAGTGGTNTVVNTGVAVDTSWKFFEVITTPTSVLYYINRALVATITTNIPYGSIMQLNWAMQNPAARAAGASVVWGGHSWSMAY